MHRGTGKLVARMQAKMFVVRTHHSALGATSQLQFPIAISFIDLNAIKMVLHTIDDLVMRAQRVGILPRPRAIAIVHELATDQFPAL